MLRKERLSIFKNLKGHVGEKDNRKSDKKDEFREIGRGHSLLLRNLFMRRQRKSSKWRRFGKQEVFAFCSVLM